MTNKSRRKFAAQRGLGFMPLNKPFCGCSAHHISKVHVIFIPVSTHKDVSHNLKTGKNIQMLNKIAFKYLYKHKENITLPLKEVQKIMLKTVNNCSGIL